MKCGKLFKLDVHVNSIYLPEDIMKSSNKINVIIETFPERCKQIFTFKTSEIKNVFCLCKFTVTQDTELILFVFRQIDLLENNPIFATTILTSSNFPKLNSLNEHIIGIYKTSIPDSNGIQISKSNYMNNKNIGQIELQLLLTKFDSVKFNNPDRFHAKKSNSYNLGKRILLNEESNDENQAKNSNIYYT